MGKKTVKKVLKKKVKVSDEEEVKDEADEADEAGEDSSVESWAGPENPVDGDVVVLGETTYRFKDVIEQPFDVQIGLNAKESLKNLDKAVKQIGESGKHYFEGTRGESLVPLNITL